MGQQRTVGDRLKDYVGDDATKKMSIRSFAGVLGKRKPRPRGSTRAMIHRYLSGATPPAEFTIAAAEVLGLNPEWLAFGVGWPTEAHEQAAAAAADHKTDTSATVLIKRAILGNPADLPARDEFIPYWVAPLADLWLLRDLIPYKGSDKAQLEALAGAIKAPLEELGLSATEMSDAALSDYIMSMIPVLNGLASYKAQIARTAIDKQVRDETHRKVLSASTKRPGKSREKGARKKGTTAHPQR